MYIYQRLVWYFTISIHFVCGDEYMDEKKAEKW